MRIQRCGFLSLTQGTTIGPVVDDSYALVWMDEGSCEADLDDETITVTRHDFLLCPPGVAATYRFTADSERMGYLYFYADHDPGWRRFYHVPSDDLIPVLQRHLLWLQLTRPAGWIAALDSATRYLLDVLSTGASRTDLGERPSLPEPIERVLTSLRARWDQGPMRSPTLAELAQSARVGPEYLARIFTRALGHPPLLTLRLLRLHHAATLLRQTDRPVRTIAFDCGYANEYHFSEAFKAWSGLAPTVFRSARSPAPELPPDLAQIARYLRGYWVERVLAP